MRIRVNRQITLMLIAVLVFVISGVGFANAEVVTIRFQDWRLAETPAGPCLEDIVSEFEKQNPDIKVELDAVSINDKLTKFVTQSHGGDPPDVVRILTTDVPGWVDMGLLLPLDDLAAKAGGKEYIDLYASFLVEAMTIDSKLYGIPHEGDALVIYYNSGIFEEAGLDPNAPPETWSDFLDAAHRITDLRDGLWAFGMLAHPSIANIWMQSWFLSQDVNFFNEDYTDTLVDSEKGIAAFKSYVELYTEHAVVPPGPTDVDYVAMLNLFAHEQVAMIVGPYATYGGILSANPSLEGKLKMMHFPGTVKASSGRGTVFSIATGSKHPEAAWRLIEFLNAPENQMKFYQEAKMLPTLNSLFLSNEIAQAPELEVMLEAIDNAVSYPIYRNWNETNRHLVDALHAALLGVKTPEKAIQDAAKAIRIIMQD